MPVTRGKLKPDDEKRLTANYYKLSQNIDGQFCVAFLYSKGVFTLDDKEEINKQPSKVKRTELMLDKLLDSGPGGAFNAFIEILTQIYPHLAEELINTNVDEILPDSKKLDYSWLDSYPDEVKDRIITDSDASRISRCLDENWRHVITRLGLSNNVIDMERQRFPFGSPTNVITSLLIKWKQQFFKHATIGNLLKVLKEVDEDDSCKIDWERVDKSLTNSR